MFARTIPSAYNRIRKSVLADNTRLLDLTVRIAALAFLLDDIIEFRNFVRDLRIFLPTPVWSAVSSLPVWSDWLLSDLHIVGLIFLLWRPRLWPAAIAVLSITVLRILGDLMQLQPFTMMYGFTVLMAALSRAQERSRLQALRLMVVGVYFWAGFNKLNTGFYLQVFPWFISLYWRYPMDWPLTNIAVFAVSFTVPVFEALIGIFLVFRNTRRLATYMALVMVVVILACLGPFGHNWAIAVWPWNVYLFGTEFCLFLSPHPSCLYALRESWPARLAAGIFIIAPVFGIWNLWDAGPSFKLYSGNVETAAIILDRRENKEHLPGEIVAVLDFDSRQSENGRSGTLECSTAYRENIFAVESWLVLARMSPYPNEFVERMGSRGLCGYLEYPARAVLRIWHPGEFDSMRRTLKEQPLCPDKS